MGVRRLCLLPGMHGSAELFADLVACAGARLQLSSVTYPEAGPQDYASLQQHVMAQLPSGEGGDARDGDDSQGGYVIVAESFGGPLALRIAASEPPGLRALVLVNSFVAAPTSAAQGLAGLLALPLASRFGVPARLVRSRMLGSDASDALVGEVRRVLGRVPAATLAARLRVLLTANEMAAYLHTQLPIFYLRSETDRLVPESALDTLIRVRPGLQVHRTPGPHLLLQRHPQAALSLIERCLQERA